MSIVNEDKISIGRRCQEERERLGLSRAFAAESCGKTPQAIGEYERGVSYPGSEALLGFARLGMDTQYILTGVRSMNLLMVAGETPEYRTGAVKKQVDPEVLQGVIEGVKEYLVETGRKLSPAMEAELVMLLLDFMNAESVQDKSSVREAVAKVIEFKFKRR